MRGAGAQLKKMTQSPPENSKNKTSQKLRWQNGGDWLV
jgi:hypothetical protein